MNSKTVRFISNASLMSSYVSGRRMTQAVLLALTASFAAISSRAQSVPLRDGTFDEQGEVSELTFSGPAAGCSIITRVSVGGNPDAYQKISGTVANADSGCAGLVTVVIDPNALY
ncbi:MAG: hypothetical protein L0Z50_08585, partial [Verrucomicrobiales bacterium]|nr:hypothetical protein [Verrucomicrobiales bacterium]